MGQNRLANVEELVSSLARFVIEHPEWIVPELTAKLELRRHSDKGRIYRVYPVGRKPRPIPRLDKLDTAGLVAALDSPSGWQRDMAQQMLLWRADKAAVAILHLLSLSALRGATVCLRTSVAPTGASTEGVPSRTPRPRKPPAVRQRCATFIAISMAWWNT